MISFKKASLVTSISALSAYAAADLRALDDRELSAATGQAGLTIDIETKWSIGEFQYKDAGSILLTGISMGGNGAEDSTYSNAGGSYLDNLRMTLDVAGAGNVDGSEIIATDSNGSTGLATTSDNTFHFGFSEIKQLATTVVSAGNGANDLQLAAFNGTDADTGNLASSKRSYGDGDLVIHWGFNDAWQKGGGFASYLNGTGGALGNQSLSDMSWADLRDIATRSVDFNFSIDAIGLADSSYAIGANTANSEWRGGYKSAIDTDTSDTVLISGLDVRGYLGPSDLHIQNNGNNFGADGSTNLLDLALNGANANSGNADSKIIWGSYFRITDLDVYLDIAGLQLRGVEIKNTRGDLTDIAGDAAFGFAHSIRTIYAVNANVLKPGATGGSTGSVPNYVDGIGLEAQFKGDIDIAELSFGDTEESIGSIYLTDINSDTKWVISAH